MSITFRPMSFVRLSLGFLAWSWFTASFTAGTGESDRDVKIHFALLGLCVWFSFTLPRSLDGFGRGRHGGKETRLCLSWDSDGAGKGINLRWRLWRDEHSWESQTPLWLEFSIDLLDVLFGRVRHQQNVVETWCGPILMPEGAYDAKVEIIERKWGRPRLPWFLDTNLRTCSVDVPAGIEYGGDALFGLSRPAASVPQAIAATVSTVTAERVPGRMYQHRRPRRPFEAQA